MAKALKFNFTDLENQSSGLQQNKPETKKRRVYTDVQIDEIKNSAFADGAIAGEKAALSRVEQRIATALDQLKDQYANLLAGANDFISSNLRQSAELALLISKSLVPELIARQPGAEIEQLLTECITHLKTEPRIVIRVEEALVEFLREHVGKIAHQAGYPGKIILLGDPEAQQAQCHIEWSEGGVMHRSREQQDLIEQKILDYVSNVSASPPAFTAKFEERTADNPGDMIATSAEGD